MVDEGDFAHLAAQHTLGGEANHEVVQELAGAVAPEPVWRNDLGGLTFRFADT